MARRYHKFIDESKPYMMKVKEPPVGGRSLFAPGSIVK